MHDIKLCGLTISSVSADEHSGIMVLPGGMHPSPHRELLDTEREIRNLHRSMRPVRAWDPPSPVRCRERCGDFSAGFSRGLTLLLPVYRSGKLEKALNDSGGLFSSEDGNLEYTYSLTPPYPEAEGIVLAVTAVRNRGSNPVTIDGLSAATLDFLSPFNGAEGVGTIRIHRFRSSWSRELDHVCESLEELGLERSWSGAVLRVESFGQIGSMPNRGLAPLVIIEDIEHAVSWGMLLETCGTWRIELQRRDDFLSVVASNGDRYWGERIDTLPPGESLNRDPVLLASLQGSWEEMLDLLRTTIRRRRRYLRDLSRDVDQNCSEPCRIIFNDWCSAWGNPSHRHISTLLPHLPADLFTHYIIDAGWYQNAEGDWATSHGDWRPSPELFPEGLEAAGGLIKEAGLEPGIWFELETAGLESRAASSEELFLTEDDRRINTGTRTFLDFRKEAAWRHIETRAGEILKTGIFTYIKVDYNEAIGGGVDGPESPGTELATQLSKAMGIFPQIRSWIPDAVIENCASGGHRLTPPYIYAADINSFSDAHESTDIPLIAANCIRIFPPELTAVWCVLREEDDLKRLSYSVAAACLGVPCISGDIDRIHPELLSTLYRWLAGYRSLVFPRISNSNIRVRRSVEPTGYRQPKGYQIVEYRRQDDVVLSIVHIFECGETEEAAEVEAYIGNLLNNDFRMLISPHSGLWSATLPAVIRWSGYVLSR